jgi:hypothetical protein
MSRRDTIPVEMENANAVRELRKIGVIWVVLAPIGWLMAAISSVKDETTYWIQLMVFTVAAGAAIVFGLAAAFRQAWARLGLIVLSWSAALFFVGSGVVVFGMTLQSGPWEMMLMAASAACVGVPFALMAHRLRRPGITAPSA